MTNSELMRAAISDGRNDDATISAALDAIRLDDGVSLLAAVLQVATAHLSGRNARDMAEATSFLDVKHALNRPLRDVIYENALNLPDGAYATVTVVAGDAPPVATDNSIDNGLYTTVLASISVGALWVKREASRLMLERERGADGSRRRRSR